MKRKKDADRTWGSIYKGNLKITMPPLAPESNISVGTGGV